MAELISTFHAVRVISAVIVKLQFILFGFQKNLASHDVYGHTNVAGGMDAVSDLGRFFSNHSDGYAFSNNHPTCFASFPRKSEPFMNYPG
jgi:hypothetical protein